MARTRRFKWSTIDQPGDYFRFAEDGRLYEDCGEYERVWVVLEDGEGLTVRDAGVSWR